MMKSGAPPDKVIVRHRLLPIEFHGFTNRIGFSLFGSWSYLKFFRDCMGPFKSPFFHIFLFKIDLFTELTI